MILVAFLRVMPGMTFLRITTTRGIEFSQSLCKMTFQGRSGLALLRVRVTSALLIRVVLTVVNLSVTTLSLALPRTIDLFPLARKLTSENANEADVTERIHPDPVPSGEWLQNWVTRESGVWEKQGQ